jgi:hypothetical protein
MDALTLTVADVEKMTEEKAQEALAAWVKAGRAELPAALASSKSKVHARAAKKALYQLKSSGVAVAAPAPEKAALAPAPAEPENDLPGVLSAPLGDGQRAVFFARLVKGGGIEHYQGVITDELGVVHMEQGSSNRSTYRKRMRELENHQELKVLLVPYGRMLLELSQALTLNERSKTPLPKGFDLAVHRLGLTPADPDVALPAPANEDAALAQRGAELHQQKEIAQWLPPKPQLDLLAQRIEEAKASPLALTDAQKAEALSARARAAAAEFFTEPMRHLYARRLWATAELFEATGRPQPGAVARAAARRLFHLAEPGRFGEQLFEKVLALSPAASAPPALKAP